MLKIFTLDFVLFLVADDPVVTIWLDPTIVTLLSAVMNEERKKICLSCKPFIYVSFSFSFCDPFLVLLCSSFWCLWQVGIKLMIQRALVAASNSQSAFAWISSED
ncbi:hypothetical protein V6N11_005865 [Hibiscus sabdariffa]|uniref:Uncharacterized protein n=1 Tax=Hibiscus sabdariffa TaxID=183260 RepID=A0ABR2RP02_9ROSI